MILYLRLNLLEHMERPLNVSWPLFFVCMQTILHVSFSTAQEVIVNLISNEVQLTCRPSWPTLVWPRTTVLILSSRRLSNVIKQMAHIEGKIQTKTRNKLLSRWHELTWSSDESCLPHHQCLPKTVGKYKDRKVGKHEVTFCHTSKKS